MSTSMRTATDSRLGLLLIALATMLCINAHAAGVNISDDFTQANDTNLWQPFDGACLTAGDGTGSIPACIGLPYYGGQVQIGGSMGFLGSTTFTTAQAPDAPGKGALRFTNWFGQAGSIIYSGAPFPTGAGLQVIFKTVTYRGNSGGTGLDGADGMGFFLMDGSFAPYDTGAFGGSLGYTCSNVNNDPTVRPADGTVRGYDGLAHAYLGLGIDEYGNFLNAPDNTATGVTNLAGTGDFQPDRIGLRGAGNVSWGGLSVAYPALYPSSLSLAQQQQAVQNTCQTGFLWDYSLTTSPMPVQTTTPASDYAAIPGANVVLSSLLPGKLIAAEAAATRGAATPITYNLTITQNGLLSFSIAYNNGNYIPVITKQDITASNGSLPGSFRFGFTGSTGGSRNVHEILCFQATPAQLGGTSVGVNDKEATEIGSGTQAFLATYYPNDWTGRLTASSLLYNATTQTLSISAIANWDAQCNLTGIPAGTTMNPGCVSTGAVGPAAPQLTPAGRSMLTWNGSAGVAFEWPPASTPTSISPAMQNTLDAGDPTPINANRLNYLRGDRTNEITSLGVGLFRSRDGILGDIVDSSPTWVGPPSAPYATSWKDQLVGTDPTPENGGAQTYTQFVAAAGTRLNVVYVGSNDGFLHGFRSGSFDSGGNFVNVANDGQEVLAYMPGAVAQTIHNSVDPTLDYANPQYSHNFFVDQTPDTDDLFYAGTWHTWLVGGLGAGGSAIYALNITDPTQFGEAQAGNLVIGEWNSTTISCANVAACGNYLGNTYGVPIVRRLHDGKWGVIFGNGFGSTLGDAGIFVMVVDPANTQGAILATYYLSTGTAGTNNGIASVSAADLDGDHITDYIYAGDLLGNVWRFDLTSASESSWAASSTPLFTTPTGEPITTKLLVAAAPQPTGAPMVMIDFGTGQRFPPTNLTSATYAPGAQALYGIWDWNLSSWNSSSATQYASLPGPVTITTGNLTTQTLTVNADLSLDVSGNPVCWSGSTTCPGGPGANTSFGWQIALPNSGEQVVYNPVEYQNAFVVNTTIPANNTPTSCQVSHDLGDTIAVSLVTGGSLHGFFRNTTDTNAAGSQTNGTGSPFIALAGGQASMLTQSLGDGATNNVTTCPKGALYCTSNVKTTGATGKRLTWVERR
jgi:type IV pilus assembly protein PilY1